MGLFIGASVLTILEIFDYLYEVKCNATSQSTVCLILNARFDVRVSDVFSSRCLRIKYWDTSYGRRDHSAVRATIW